MVISVAFVFIFIAWMWLFYPYKIVAYGNLPFPVLNEEIMAGDILGVEVEYERFSPKPSELTRELICDGDYQKTYQRLSTRFPLGKHKSVVERTAIPPIASGKTCQLFYVLRTEVNPIREIINEAYTEKFYVQ